MSLHLPAYRVEYIPIKRLVLNTKNKYLDNTLFHLETCFLTQFEGV